MKKVKDSRKRWKQLVTMLLVTALLVTGTPDIVGLASEGTQEQVTTAADQSEGTQAEGQAEAAQEEEAISEEPVEQQDTSAQQDTAAKQENTEKNIENRSTAGTTKRSENSQNSHEKDKAASGAKSGGSSTSKVRETEKNTKKEDKDTKTEYTYRGSAIQAKVTLKDAEDLSDEADLRVKQTTVANKMKTQIINKAVGEENTQLVESVKAYDLSFILNGESVTPSGSMQVTLANLGTKSGQNTLIYQVTDDGQVKNTDAVRTGSDAMQFAAKSLCTYVVLTYTTVSDVNGNDITTLYPAMVTATQTQLESKEDGNVPVESWTRTNTPLVLKDTTGKKALAWTWSDIAGIDLSLDNDSQIWNGSRSYGKHTSTALKNGRVTAKSGKLYDSALWKNEGKAGKDTTITRIRGEFTITDKNKNNYAYTLKPVTDSENIYAKDNMFVFVYPKDVELTDDNYMDYLAFWTGSLANAGEKECTFHGRTASNYTQRTPVENVSVLTDGWHMTAACNNAGSIITSTDASDYYVDVISTTDSSNGGMYRFKLVKEKKEKTQFTFRNLDTNAKTGKGGAVFELYKDGVHYSAQSENEEGRVTFNIVKPEGSDTDVYTLKETKAPEGYDKITTTWKVLVSSEGVTMVKDTEGNEMPKYPDGTYVVSSAKTDEADSSEQTAKTPSVIREYKSDDVNVTVTAENEADLPADAKLVVKPIELSQKAQENVEQAAIKEEKKAIKNILAYDIHFEADGKEVQPGATVKVSVDVPEIKAGANASVFHVDDKNKVENMDGDVDKKGNVVFETTHFSIYAIVNKSTTDKIKVTIHHYQSGTNNKIYADDEKTLDVGASISDYTKAKNWAVTQVNLNGEEQSNTSLDLTSDSTIDVYYSPIDKEIKTEVAFYDYTLKAGQVNDKYYSINQTSNYKNNGKNKLSAGTAGDNQNYPLYSRNSYNWEGNIYNRDNEGKNIVKGLVKGLDTDGNVEFNYDEPGFFVNSDLTAKDYFDGHNMSTRYLRKYYNDYKLNFAQKGDTYTLKSVKHDQNTTNAGSNTTNAGSNTTNAGSNFFPLDDNKLPYEETGFREDHNYYFGMRYDIEFTIGDYVGPLNYSFTGDDDLWVILDGKEVVVDLGGIHKAVTGETNLWNDLGLDPSTSLSEEQKSQKHTLTILYMERGGCESNCDMKFTLPSARVITVNEQKKTSFEFEKVNTEGTALPGAHFTLTNNATETQQVAISGADGKVLFENLAKGEYTLKETVPPSGYVVSLNNWTVKVTENTTTGKLEATLYLGEEKCSSTNEKYQISNQKTPEEIIRSSMDYNKTAKVIDWDKRTYKIDINASSKATSSSVTEKTGAADIMMVFDMSGSMNEDGTKEKVGKFDDIKGQLDETKVYYYNTSGETSNVTGNTYYINPMIYIDGAWKYYNGTQWENPVNKNVYTWDSRITALKEAAIAFIKDTATKSPKSKIGIATFDGYATVDWWTTSYFTRGNLIQSIQEVGSQPSGMIKNICKITADGGTSPQEGLEKAKGQLNSVKDDSLPKNIILFTDGAPSKKQDTKDTETIIGTLKKEATIFTVALGSENNTVPGSDKTNIEWMKDLATDEKHAFSASDSSKLGSIFQTINETITQNIDIENATITDVIDPRFVVVDDDNNVITKERLQKAEKQEIKLKNGGVVSLDAKGNQVVTWSEQTIKHSSSNGNSITPGWSNTITVKAKDEYIGGNNIPTNISPDSKITTGYGEAILPQPKVNVKADLLVNNTERTIFLGENTPYSDELLKVLFDKDNPQGYVNGELKKYTMGSDGNAFNSDDFSIQWYSDKNCTESLTSEQIQEDQPNNTKEYYLKVTYNKNKIGQATDESKQNTTKDDTVYFNKFNNEDKFNNGEFLAHNSEDDKARTYGVYTVKVVSGEIQISKELIGDNPSLGDDGKTFTFAVKRLMDADGTPIEESKQLLGNANVTVTFKNNQQGQTTMQVSNECLKNLSKGVYSVEEVDIPEDYYFKKLTDNTNTLKTNACVSKTDTDNNKKVIFGIGMTAIPDLSQPAPLDTTDEARLSKRVGAVTYTNQQLSTISIIKKSTDVEGKDILLDGVEFKIEKKVGNSYEEVSRGNTTNYIVPTDAEGKAQFTELEEGTYRITEIKAKNGYSLLANPIEVTLPYQVSGDSNAVIDEDKAVTYDGKKNCYFDITYTIVNNKLFNMPASGGRFKATLIGIAVMIMAAGCYILRHRRKRII